MEGVELREREDH